MTADSSFATLRLTNTLARLAFSDLYETFTTKRQNTQEDAPSAFHRMVVEASQTFDSEVLWLRLETERRVSQNAYTSDVESESLTEPDTDMEDQYPGIISRGSSPRPPSRRRATRSERARWRICLWACSSAPNSSQNGTASLCKSPRAAQLLPRDKGLLHREQLQVSVGAAHCEVSLVWSIELMPYHLFYWPDYPAHFSGPFTTECALIQGLVPKSRSNVGDNGRYSYLADFFKEQLMRGLVVDDRTGSSILESRLEHFPFPSSDLSSCC